MTQEEKDAQIREFLESQISNLERVGGISKIGELSEKEVKELENVIFDYPELDYYVLENEELFDVFLRCKSKDAKIDVGGTIESARNAFINNQNYRVCIQKLRLVLRKAAHPKSDVYDLMGLAYNDSGEVEIGNDYLRLANYLNGVRDYNNVDIDKVRERVEGNMKYNKKNNYNQYNFDLDRQVHIDRLTLPNLDKIIEYIEANHLDLETAGKQLNLTEEQIDFVKLIYAREFYKQGDMEKGNYYLRSVEKTSGKTSEVTRLCLETRTNKKFFQYRDNNQPKMLSLVKPGKRNR